MRSDFRDKRQGDDGSSEVDCDIKTCLTDRLLVEVVWLYALWERERGIACSAGIDQNGGGGLFDG